MVVATRTRSGWAAVALAVGLVLPLATAPSFDFPSWAVREALLPLLATCGLVALAGLAWSGVRAARWALVWTGWATVSAVIAPHPALALWGEYEIGTGLIFLVAVAGCWAIGVSSGHETRHRLAGVLLAGCVAQAAIAIVEQLVDLGRFDVIPLGGRSAGLYGNPVYLAELLAGGLWLALVWARERASAGRLAAVVVIAAGVELSGSRITLLLALVAAGLVLLRGNGAARWLAAAGVAAGLALGALVGNAAGPSAVTGTSRVDTMAVASDGYAPRVATWIGGLEGLAHRPVWGWGPGQFLAASGPRRDLTVARDEGPDAMFADAHDWVIESAVTTGLVGLLLLVLWLSGAVALARRRPGSGPGRSGPTASEVTGAGPPGSGLSRSGPTESGLSRSGPAESGLSRARPPGSEPSGLAAPGFGLLGFAGFVMAVTLVEPLHVGVTPLAALALGAAGSGVALRPVRRGAVVVAAAVVALGAVVSVGLLTGLADLRRGSVDDTAGVAEAAARRLPPWGRPAAEAGTVVAFDGIASGSASDQASALRWWALAARQDPADPAGWNDLAGALDAAGQPAAAATAYRRALADNPWSLLALRGLVRVGPAAGVAPSELAAAEDRLARLDRNRA